MITTIATGCSTGAKDSIATDSTKVGQVDLGSLGRLPGQFPQTPAAVPEGEKDAPVGACVSVTGPRENAGLKTVACGTAENNYIVIQRVRWPAECVADSDRKYYRNSLEGEWTACLDLAWSRTDCLVLSPDDAQRVACSNRSALGREKPTGIFIDTVNADRCDLGGYAHPVRRFTICTETQK